MKKLFLGIDLGGTNIKVGCFDADLNLLCKDSTATDVEMGEDVVIDNIVQTANKLLADNSLKLSDVAAIGVGSPGTLNISEGVIISTSNFPCFRNTPLRRILSEKFGKPVVFENDANAACWGEYVAGAGKGADDILFFTLGTGIGGAILTNGQLVHGFCDNAGELGHIVIQKDGRPCGCGQQGCVEAYSSAGATAKRATEAVEAGAKSGLTKVLVTNGEITCKDVFEHYKKNDRLAKNIVEGSASALGLLCVNLLHVTGPKRVVFSGGMIGAGDILLERIRHFFKQYIWPLKEEKLEICFATLGEDAGIIGTAALAIQASNSST